MLIFCYNKEDVPVRIFAVQNCKVRNLMGQAASKETVWRENSWRYRSTNDTAKAVVSAWRSVPSKCWNWTN